MADSAVPLKIERLNKQEWTKFSEDAHAAVFGKVKPAEWDRIDYAWLVVQGDKPVSYVTVRELDHESVYWQFGGGFPWAWKSILMNMSLQLMLAEQAKVSKSVSCRVENLNYPMLRLALKHGFLIIGTRHIKTTTLVELAKELSNGDDTNVSDDAESAASSEEAADSSYFKSVEEIAGRK